MNERNIFLNNFFSENPKFPKEFVHFYKCERDGSAYGILCNFVEQNSISSQEIEKIQNLSKEKGALSSFCEVFSNNPKMLELATDYILKTNNLDPSLEDLLNFVKSSKRKDKEVSLGRDNTITAFKLDEDLKITDDVSFKLDFSVEEIKRGKQASNRLFIESAESFERGKGIYTEILRKVIPAICEANKLSVVVLEASAFEGDGSEKGGQEKLENFYRAQGFSKASESFDENPFVKSSDFDEGLPVFYKQIEMEHVFE